jgi:hypothetical protein
MTKNSEKANDKVHKTLPEKKEGTLKSSVEKK